MLVVTTPGWNAVNGDLQRFEWHGKDWQAIGDKIAIVVGKNGIGWDGTVDLPFKTNDPVKKEGDGRSPAGVFPVTTLFGFDAAAFNQKMPYRQLTDSIECVDDASSISYNKVVDRSEIRNPEWNSSEKMRTIDVYKQGAVIGYNGDSLPGAGSCIFLHIWRGTGRGTAGCTAMSETQLLEVLNWLDESKKPVVVQMPASAYSRARVSWDLP